MTKPKITRKILRLYKSLSKMKTDEAIRWMESQIGSEHMDALDVMLGILEREFGKTFTSYWFDMFKFGVCSNAVTKEKVGFHVLVFLAWTGLVKYYGEIRTSR